MGSHRYGTRGLPQQRSGRGAGLARRRIAALEIDRLESDGSVGAQSARHGRLQQGEPVAHHRVPSAWDPDNGLLRIKPQQASFLFEQHPRSGQLHVVQDLCPESLPRFSSWWLRQGERALGEPHTYPKGRLGTVLPGLKLGASESKAFCARSGPAQLRPATRIAAA